MISTRAKSHVKNKEQPIPGQNFKKSLFLLSILPLLWAGRSYALTIPSTAEPSRVQGQIAPAAPQRPPAAPEVISPAPAGAAPQGAEKAQFVLQTLTVEGMTVYHPKDIVPLYLDMVGKTISLVDVYNLAEKLTVKYRNDGYILTQAFVPPQTIDNGHITLKAVEGFVDQVIIHSKDERDNAILAPYAAAIEASRPLNARVLEKNMLLINDLPGFSARSVLSPSLTVPGSSDLMLEITHKPYGLTFGADNRGSRYMGPLQANAGLRLNNFLGLRESINMQVLTSPGGSLHREVDFGSLGITKPVGSDGTTVTVSGSVTSTLPGYKLKPLEVKGISHSYNIEMSHPFIRSRAENLFATLKFMYLDSARTDNLGLGKTEDKLRVLRLSSAWQFSDKHRGNNTLTGEISKGLDVLGTKPQGSPNMTRAKGNPEFFKVTAEASRVQGLTEHLDLFTSVTGQWSASPLLASEEFGVGGSAYGSAYDGSEITGRNGLAVRIEMRDTNRFMTPIPLLQFYGFYDVGQVWDPDNATAADRMRSLASTGLGLRALLNDAVSCSVELAVPLTRPVAAQNNSNDPRLFMAVSAQF